jgi:hypothetical protein
MKIEDPPEGEGPLGRNTLRRTSSSSMATIKAQSACYRDPIAAFVQTVVDLVEIQTITPVYLIYRNNVFPLWAVNKYFERKTTKREQWKTELIGVW